MTPVAAVASLRRRPPARRRPDSAVAGRAQRPLGGRLTLADKLASIWEGLHADGVAQCPVCHGPMQRSAAGDGECTRCGTRLG